MSPFIGLTFEQMWNATHMNTSRHTGKLGHGPAGSNKKLEKKTIPTSLDMEALSKRVGKGGRGGGGGGGGGGT